jgi:hypothetical protein
MQTLSATPAFRKRPRPLTRCKGGQDKQTPAGAERFAADGFLKHRFLPVYETSEELPQKEKVEPVYLKAVRNLTAYYKINAIDVRDYPYPYNILLSNWDISRQIETKGRYREIRIEETEDRKINLSVTESLNTGSTLYYIPLVPVFKALHLDGNRCAPLLLSVCVYLYRQAGVCHFKEDESYIAYLYEIMDNWIEDDRESMDEADYKEQRAILDEVFFIGDEMKAFLNNEKELEQLQSKIQQFEPISPFDRDCLRLAKETLALWMEFPNANLYQNIGSYDNDEEEDDYYSDGKIKVTDYISFIGETSSCVYDTMMEMLNNDFNERSGIQDFENTIVFNKPRRKFKDILAYEERVIGIITDLCDLIPELT